MNNPIILITGAAGNLGMLCTLFAYPAVIHCSVIFLFLVPTPPHSHFGKMHWLYQDYYELFLEK